MRNQSVLVVGDYPQALATVRSLHRGGYGVVLARDHNRTYVEASRHCDEVWQYQADFASEGFGRELAEFLGQRQDICAIFPVGEPEIARLVALKPALPSRVRTVAVNGDILAMCVTKTLANEWASEAGIAVPESQVVSNHSELEKAVEALGFPVILKSLRTEARVNGRKAFIVSDEEEFRQWFDRWPDGLEQLLVQQYIVGELCGCDFVAWNGDIVAFYQGESYRTDMPDGTGFGVEFVSSAPENDLFRALSSLVKTRHYEGPGLLQCIRSESGELFFIEVNPRLSAGVADSINAGMNTPLLAVKAALELDLPAIEHVSDAVYQFGYRSYWLERDVLGWIKQRNNLTSRESWQWLMDIGTALVRADSHVNWQWRDPLPSLTIVSNLLARVLQYSRGDH